MTLILIIAGYILEHNGQWFNGAHTLGHWMFVVGIILAVIEVVFWIIFAIGGIRALR